MNEEELSKEWRRLSLQYVGSINAYVERGRVKGWDNAGPQPEDHRQHLANDVLEAVKRANRKGDAGAPLREKFPPAWEPFLPIIREKGQSLSPVVWIDDRRIAIHVGAFYEAGPVLVVTEGGVVEQPDVLSLGVRRTGRCSPWRSTTG